MTGIELALAGAVVTLGATVQRTLGFGASLVSIPLLLLIDPQLVPGPATVAGITLVLLMALTSRAETDWRGVRWMVIGLIPGTVVAAVTLTLISPDVLAVLAGSLILAAVIAAAAGRRPQLRRRAMLGSGALSGFMGTAAGIGGPPIALLYSSERGSVLRATLAPVFLTSAVMTLVALSAAHKLGGEEWIAGLAMAPGGLVGHTLGGRLDDRLDPALLRRAVLAISGLSALVVIARVVA